MRNRLINDATSFLLPGQSRYRMVVHRGAQYRQPAESATVNPYGGRTEAAAPDAERDEEEGNASRGVSAFFGKSCRDYYYPLKHPEIYTSRYLKRRNYCMINCKIWEIWICCIFLLRILLKLSKQRVWSVIRIQQNLTKICECSLWWIMNKTNITHPVFPCYQRGWDGIRCFRYRAGWLVLFSQ